MATSPSRYGFVLTNQHPVTLRLRREPTHPGIARDRPRRELISRMRQDSDISMMSGHSSGSEFSDNNPLNWSWSDPEFVIIDWQACGEGHLTVKLALWCLAMMATNGESFIDDSYPDLNTWRKEGEQYVHNASGARKSKLDENDLLVLC
ncbi:hypothetical protein F4861DRAFT_158627 [Xylaria intraflava]|nr:hypothetical protein F4861DRAFT_158627 [Xylaria intraflava]